MNARLLPIWYRPSWMVLGHATAVLNCLMVAAMYDENIDASAVAKVACGLVSKAIDRLDSVELLQAVEGRSAEIPP